MIYIIFIVSHVSTFEPVFALVYPCFHCVYGPSPCSVVVDDDDDDDDDDMAVLFVFSLSLFVTLMIDEDDDDDDDDDDDNIDKNEQSIKTDVATK